MVWETEDTIDIILSVVITALGLIPLLNNYNIISFALPAIFSNTILVYAITLIAIYLIITGFRYYSDSVMKWPTLLVGGIVFLLGLANILGKFSSSFSGFNKSLGAEIFEIKSLAAFACVTLPAINCS